MKFGMDWKLMLRSARSKTRGLHVVGGGIGCCDWVLVLPAAALWPWSDLSPCLELCLFKWKMKLETMLVVEWCPLGQEQQWSPAKETSRSDLLTVALLYPQGWVERSFPWRRSSCTDHPAVCDDPQPHTAGGVARAYGGWKVSEGLHLCGYGEVIMLAEISQWCDVLVLRVPMFL